MANDTIASSPITQRSRIDARSIVGSTNTATTDTVPTSTASRNANRDTFVRDTRSTTALPTEPTMPRLANADTRSVYLEGIDDADAQKTVKVDVNLAQAYGQKNPELDAWRQATMKAGYGDVMGFVEASRDASKDFNWLKQGTSADFPDSLAAFKAANGGREPPTKISYELHTKDLEDGRAAMKLGYDSLTEYQRYGLTDDKAARLAPLQNALLSSTAERSISASTPPLAGLTDRKLAALGERLSNFTSVVRRRQGGEAGLDQWIDGQAKALRGLGSGSPMNKDINAYVSSVLAGTQATPQQTKPTDANKEQPGAGSCVGVNVTVGPFTGGLSQCSNNKVYGTVGVTTAIGLSADQQTSVVLPNDGKTVDDVVSGDSEGVNVSSAKIGGSGSVTTGGGGTTVSAGPSVGIGLPAGIVKTTTVQIGTYTPQPADTRKQDDIPMTKSRKVLVSKLGVPQ